MPRPCFAFRNLAAALILASAALLSSCENPAGNDDEPGPPARLDIVSGDLQTGTVDAELPQPLVARVVDDRGKPISGQVVNFRVTAGGGSVFAGTAVTNAEGEARERWTLGTVAGDTQRVEARAVDPATGQPLVFATFRAIGRAGAPAAIVPVGEATRTGTAGFPLGDSLMVKVLDRFGNGVGGATVAWTVRRGGGSLSPPVSTANAEGVAKSQWTLGTWVDSTQVAEAAAAVGLSTSFVASSGIPAGATLVVRGGAGQTGTVGTTLAQPVKVALLLPDGRPVVGAAIAWSVGSTGGGVNPASSVTDAAGEATVQWTLPTLAGTATLTASAPGAAAVSVAATAAPGPATSLVRVSGDGQIATAGVPLPDSLVVRARDAHGNDVPGVSVAWSTSNGTLSPASTTTRADGTARTRWTPAEAAVSNATATASGLTPVTFTTRSQGNIAFSFTRPGSETVTQDLLDVQVALHSTYSVTGATARVGDRTVVLARAAAGSTTWTGRISLAGLPRGTYTLKVTATDATGAASEGTKSFVLDRPPTVEFRSPVSGSVWPAGGTVRVIAVCRDDDPGGCAKLEVNQGYYYTVNLRTGKDSLDFTIAAPASGDSTRLTAFGHDTGGSTVWVYTSIIGESGPRLVQAAAVPGRVLDFDGGRVLYLASTSGAPTIRTLSSGADQVISPTGHSHEQWKLTPRGALLIAGSFNPGARLYEWRDGAAVDLGRISHYQINFGYLDVAYPVVVEGSWAVWRSPGGLMRRDLDAGTSTVVYSGGGSGEYYAGVDDYDVAANGDVVFSRRLTSSSPTEVLRYRGGTASPLVSGSPAGRPRTDGVNVVAVVDNTVVLIGPARTDTLTRGDGTLTVSAEYDAVDGWAAYHWRPSANVLQVFLRSPAGVEHHASASFDSGRLRALGPGGQAVLQASNRLWLYTAGGQPVDIASTTGTPVWRNGELYILVGNTVFRVQR